MSADFESDLLLRLLTDALREGPRSPVWDEAVKQARAAEGAWGKAGTVELTEAALLLRVRDLLASGSAYREVRPGPAFSRRVLAEIDRDHARPSLPTGNIVAVLCAAVVVAGLGAAAFFLLRGNAERPAAVEDLQQLYFVETVAASPVAGELAEGWMAFGARLPPAIRAAEKDVGRAAPSSATGGVYWNSGLAAQKPASAEAIVRLAEEAGGVVELFVTDDLAGIGEGSPRQLTCTVAGREARAMLPDGRLAGTPVTVEAGATIALRIRFSATDAIVEASGRKLWSGRHGLDEHKPRYVGVREVWSASGGMPASIESIRIQCARMP